MTVPLIEYLIKDVRDYNTMLFVLALASFFCSAKLHERRCGDMPNKPWLGVGMATILLVSGLVGCSPKSAQAPVKQASSASATLKKQTSSVAGKAQASKKVTPAQAKSASSEATAKQASRKKAPVTQAEVKADAVIKQIFQNSDFAKLPGDWSLSYQGIQPKSQPVNLTNLPQGQTTQFAASTIKVFILMTLLDQVNHGQVRLEQRYTLTQADKVGGTGSLQGQANGNEYTMRQLAALMMTQSDNTATNIIIKTLGGGSFTHGFKVVNTYAATHGYTQTKLQRKMMDLTNKNNNIIAASEACDLLVQFYTGKLAGITSAQRAWILTLMSSTTNRQKFPAAASENIHIYNKSGESGYQGIQNDLAIVTHNKQAYVVVGLSQLYQPHTANPGKYLDAGLNASSAVTQRQIAAFGQLSQALSKQTFNIK